METSRTFLRVMLAACALVAVGCGGNNNGTGDGATDVTHEASVDAARSDVTDATDATEIATSDASDITDATDVGTDAVQLDVADASDAAMDSGAGDTGSTDTGSVDSGGTDTGTTDTGSTDSGGGTGTVGDLCSSAADCASGLLCCYPCGIPGCMDRCTVPIMGRCPLIP